MVNKMIENPVTVRHIHVFNEDLQCIGCSYITPQREDTEIIPRKTLVVNLFAGPGAGKSTLAYGITSALKMMEVNAELASEYVKDKVWEESYKVLDNQIYVFGKQLHRIWRLLGKVDVVVTDSPIFLSHIYAKEYSKNFTNLILDEHNKMQTLNVLLFREKKYVEVGRIQTEEEAKKLDTYIQEELYRYDIKFIQAPGNINGMNLIISKIGDILGGLLDIQSS